MLIHTQMKHDITCWMIAIGLHLLLFLMNFNLMRNIEPGKLVPIVEVEYLTPEDIISASRVGAPGEPPKTFKEKLKHFFSKEIAPPKKEEVLAGKGPSKPEVNEIGSLSQEKTLIDKQGSLSRKVDLSPTNDSKGKLISESKEEEILLASKELNLTDLKSQNLKDKEYKIAKKDLPFQIATREEIEGNGTDIVGIDLGKETSKSILTQAPTLKDIKGKGDFAEGVFRVVKQEKQRKLSGSEVLANLLAMAKKEEARRLEEYGSGLGSGGTLAGKEEYTGSGIGVSALGSGGGTGRGGGGLVQGVKGVERIGAGEGATATTGAGGSPTGVASQGSSPGEAKSEEKEVKRTFKKGVVFSRAPREKEGLAGSGTEETSSSSKPEKAVAKKGPRGRVIFEIRGPLSQRKVLRKVIPSYPEWAEKEGIEAGVSVHFVVLSNGEVKDNIYVVRTSGYPVIDQLVMGALRQWQFASLEGDFYGKEEWGILTFYFSLEGGPDG